MSASATNAGSMGNNNPIVRLLRSEYVVLVLTVVYAMASTQFAPGFFSRDNLPSLLLSALPLFVVAMGQTVVLITGGIDLSVTSIIALASVAGAGVMNGQTGPMADSVMAVPVGIAVMLGAGAVVGGLNGFAVTAFRMPPFIVTLTSMIFFSGLAVWATQSQYINDLPNGFNALGSTPLNVVIIAAMAGFAAHGMLSRSLWGRWIYAVGHSARAAEISGVPTGRVIVSAYIVSGVLAGLASVLLTGQLETGSPVLGQNMLLDVVGATVIGGTSLFGGKGRVAWTLFGVIFIKLVDNSLNLAGLSHFTIMMVKGGVILLAALLDAFRTRLGQTA